MIADRTGTGDAALTRCIPCTPEEFAARYWGRSPLLARASQLPRDFDDLFGPSAVDELVSTHGLRTPFARMARDGSVIASARFTRSGGAGATIADQLADDKVLTALAEGSTLVLQGLHRTWPAIVRFAATLVTELGHPVQVNSYITPPQNRGFAAHYDVHDVIVLQVCGRKQWTIHEPVVDAPLSDQPWEQHRAEIAARVANDAPVLDTVLEPGDALYLPRGTIHAASALGETSIHLTIGIHPVTRRDLARHLLELAVEAVELRTSLPAGVDLSDPAVIAEELASTVAALVECLPAVGTGEVADRIARGLARDTRPEPISPLAQLTAAESLTAESLVRVRSGLRARLDVSDDTARLMLPDRTVTAPAHAADALKRLLDGPVIGVADLPGLGEVDRVALVRRLVREGVVVLD